MIHMHVWRYAIATILAIALVGISPGFSATPRLVREINPTIIPVDSLPANFIDQNSWSFLVASDGLHGVEPWATDGTSAGTFRLGSVNPLPTGVTGISTVRVGAITFFFTSGSANAASALWRTDGTAAGTRLVVDVADFGVNPSLVGALDGKLIFTLFEADAGREFWQSDGTAAGTYRITDVNGTASGAADFAFANGRIYFLALTGTGVEPWVTDGTQIGTHRLATLPDAMMVEFAPLTRVGNFLLFAAATGGGDGELWRIDLSNDSVTSILSVPAGQFASLELTGMQSLGNVALFAAPASSGDRIVLWRSDGTPGGTRELANVRPLHIANSMFVGPSGAGGAIFLGDDGVNGPEIWSSDGTTAAPLTATPDGFGISPNSRIGSTLYFTVTDFQTDVGQLWRTDGTPAHTQQLTGFTAGRLSRFELAGDDNQLFVRIQRNSIHFDVYRINANVSSPTLLRTYMTPLGQAAGPAQVFAFARGSLYFDSNHPVSGRELWISDGTPAGTRLVRNMAPETRSQPSSPANFVELNGRLYFTANDGEAGNELWRSDGTSGGTQLAVEVNPGSESAEFNTLFTSNGRLFFFARNTPFEDYKLWSTDGTAAGTTAIGALNPLAAASTTQPPCGEPAVTLGTHAYFAARDRASGAELWKTDGTPSGTVRVSNIGPDGAEPCWLTQFGGRIFFSATQFGSSGRELWSVDGSGAAPALVADLLPGPESSDAASLKVLGGALFFFARNANGVQLWRSDGTAAGTMALTSSTLNPSGGLQVVRDKLAFVHSRGGFSNSLWVSDGTVAGTGSLPSVVVRDSALLSDGRFGYFRGLGASSFPQQFDPWVTDGTEAGTRLLFDSDAAGVAPILFWNFRGVTLLQTSDDRGNAKLWSTDGTGAGTRAIGDIGVAPIEDYPVKRLAVGQTFFFVSDDGTTGVELFAVDNDTPIAANDAGGPIEAGKSAAISVLANDSDPDGALDAASVMIASMPAGGTVSVSPGGVVTYTARADFSGSDSFIYTVADNQGARSAPAQVQVTVTARPVAPPSSGGSGGGGGSLRPLELSLWMVLLLATIARRYSSGLRHFRGACGCINLNGI